MLAAASVGRQTLLLFGLLQGPLAHGQTAPATLFDTHLAAPATKLPPCKVKQPVKQLSSYTVPTRQRWQDVARYLPNRVLSYVRTLDDPMQFPKQPGKSYPRSERQVTTEKLEGLCRTLFLAAPLLKEEPGGMRVAEYYRYQISQLVNSASPSSIKPRAANGGPSHSLVKFGGLAVVLFAEHKILWDSLPKATQDALTTTMFGYGDGPTVGPKWRYCNIFMLSFSDTRGYAVNKQLMEEYPQKQLTQHRGDGWYHDESFYDYYSIWPFQLYGKLRTEYYGCVHYPDVVAQLVNNFNGQPTPCTLRNGYAVLLRKWRKGDVVEIILPLKVRRVVANLHEGDDLNKVVLQRGPVIYCAEWADNQGWASNIIVPPLASFTSAYKPDLLNGVMTLTATVPAVRVDEAAGIIQKVPQTLTAIPY